MKQTQVLRLALLCLLTTHYSLLTTTHAQTVAQLTKAAEQRFDAGDFYAAAAYYKQALAKDEDNSALNFRYAESLRMFNDYKGAATAYANTVKADKAFLQPLALFWWAEMLKSRGKYDEALKQFTKFKGKYRTKDFYAAKTLQEIESCNWAKANAKPDSSINILPLGDEVNTEKSEFNAMHVSDAKIQFSALRNISEDKKKEDYRVRIYNQPPTPNALFMPDGSDAAQSIGNGNYSPDVRYFFFTQCENAGRANTRCDIYLSEYKDYKFQPAQKLSINDASATNTHPAYGEDAAGNKVLYFASNRKGGEGELDLWQSKMNADGSFAAAQNLGKAINSAGNEVTPYYDFNEATLYFSSDWHYGFGSYDVFATRAQKNGWSAPRNLMQPINSAQNDLYYSVASDNSRAYITSNRVGSKFIEAETCCNDIYAYNTGKKVERKKIEEEPKRDTVVVAEVVAEVKKDTTMQRINDANPYTPQFTETPPQTEKQLIDTKLKHVKQLLPVSLYFHNDEPECCNLRDTTSLDYKETYEAYSSLLVDYKKQYAKGLSEGQKMEAEQAIFYLFTNRVDKGFRDLVTFTTQLYELLQAGEKLEVTVQGYCSPLNYNIYNIHLGNRRVASVRNFFFHWHEGALLPYIGSGQLNLKNQSLGEETANKTVSDKLEDTRNSVYNPDAAKERKVEIISVELK